MSESTPRGNAAGRTTPAGRRAPPASAISGGKATGKSNARPRLRKPDIEIDRIVVLRFALVLVVLAFLYLIVWIGTRAFGDGARQSKTIDRVIIDATAPTAPPAAPRTDPAKPGTLPP